MKKVLFATTALVAFAGAAAADVTVSGDGRMGIVSDELRSETDATLNNAHFNSRIRISFAASGETDNGLSFGGAIRADNAGAGAAGTAGNVFISGGFGRLSMGDVSSAAENAVGDLAEVGYTGISGFNLADLDPALDFGLGNEMIYLTSDDTEILLYSYTIEGLSLFASVGQPGDDNTTWSVGASYDAGGFGFALGHEDQEDVGSHTIVSASATVGDLALEAIYGTAEFDDVDEDITQWGVGGTYTMGAVRADAFYRSTDLLGEIDINSMGIGMTYALGGGAAIEGGVAQIDADDETFQRFDLGMTFRF